MNENLPDIWFLPGIEPSGPWEYLTDFEDENLTSTNTPTRIQHHLEVGSPLQESGENHFDTWCFQPRPSPTTDSPFQQSLFQGLDESRIPANSNAAAKVATQERLSCDRPGCTSSFTRQADLQRHVISRHDKGRSYKCAVNGCEKTFYRQDKLLVHRRRQHTAEFPFLQSDVSPATLKAEHHQAQIHPDFEYFLNALDVGIDHAPVDGSNYSIQEHVGRISGRDRQSNPESSTPATEYSVLTEETSGASDLISSGGSISTRSRSPCKAISCSSNDTVNFSSQGQDECTRRRFPCPYHKHDPQTYNIRRYRTCTLSSWDTLPRLK